MSRKRAVLLAIFLLVAVAGIAFSRRNARLLREEKERERRTATLTASLSIAIKGGETRREIDAYLRSQHVEFFERSGSGQSIYDDFAPLGRRPSGGLYCGPIRVGVEISFHPATQGPLIWSETMDDPKDTFWKIEP